MALEIIKYLNTRSQTETEYIENQIRNLRAPFINYIFPLPRGKNETVSDNPYASLDEKTLQEIQNELRKKIDNPYYEIKLNSAQNIKISSIRALKKHLSINKKDIAYSAIIIDKAELMSTEAQNSLLKNLEEPPEGVIFFLLTKDESLLLPTIKSRCWTVNFSNLTKREVETVLVRYFDVDETTAKKVSPFANGSIKEASLFLEENSFALIDLIIEFLRNAIGGNFNSAYALLEEMLSITENNLPLIINLTVLWLEDALLEKYQAENEYSFDMHKDTFIRYNRAFPNADIIRSIEILQRYANTIKQNVSLKIILMNIIFQLSTLGKRQL